VEKKSLKVDRKKFEGIVENLLQTKPMKRGECEGQQEEAREVNPAAEVESYLVASLPFQQHEQAR